MSSAKKKIIIYAALFVVGLSLLLASAIAHEAGITEGTISNLEYHAATFNRLDQYKPHWTVTITEGGKSNTFSVSEQQWKTLFEGETVKFVNDKLTTQN